MWFSTVEVENVAKITEVTFGSREILRGPVTEDRVGTVFYCWQVAHCYCAIFFKASLGVTDHSLG